MPTRITIQMKHIDQAKRDVVALRSIAGSSDCALAAIAIEKAIARTIRKTAQKQPETMTPTLREKIHGGR